MNIPKGTFYLFYQSKELLLFDAILEQHELIERELMESVSGIDPSKITALQLTDILVGVYKKAAQSSILNIMDSNEIDLLTRKLPPEVVEEHCMRN